MSISKPYRWHYLGLALLCGVALLWGWLRLNSAHQHRPLFYNQFHAKEFEITPSWKLAPNPLSDSRGNLLLLDIKLNIILLVHSPAPGIITRSFPKTYDLDGVATLREGRRFQLHLRTNEANIADMDGEWSYLPLNVGEAKAIYEQVYRSGNADSDLYEILMQVLGERPKTKKKFSP